MTTTDKPGWLEERIDAALSGELDSLEGEQDASELWNYLQQNPAARSEYDAMVVALRAFANKTGVKSFYEAEADALWPVVMGGVSHDARTRSGLSKQALRHLAVPELVASITNALSGLSKRVAEAETKNEEVVFELPVSPATPVKDLDFSIASVGGEVSLRLYHNDEIDVRCQVNGDEVRSNVSDSDTNWREVATALSQLSSVTARVLGEEVLVNGRIAIHDGRAEIRLNPLNVVRAFDKK